MDVVDVVVVAAVVVEVGGVKYVEGGCEGGEEIEGRQAVGGKDEDEREEEGEEEECANEIEGVAGLFAYKLTRKVIFHRLLNTAFAKNGDSEM